MRRVHERELKAWKDGSSYQGLSTTAAPGQRSTSWSRQPAWATVCGSVALRRRSRTQGAATKQENPCLWRRTANTSSSNPRILACETISQFQKVAVVYNYGAFSIFSYDMEAKVFAQTHRRTASSGSTITSLVLSDSCLRCMNGSQVLSLFRFTRSSIDPIQDSSLLARLEPWTT